MKRYIIIKRERGGMKDRDVKNWDEHDPNPFEV
jgi:hypothetical protein